MPKNPNCKVCQTAKLQRKQKRRKSAKAGALLGGDGVEGTPPTKFGQQATGDHLINTRSKDAQFDEYPDAHVGLVILDIGTSWVDVFPKGSKSTADTK